MSDLENPQCDYVTRKAEFCGKPAIAIVTYFKDETGARKCCKRHIVQGIAHVLSGGSASDGEAATVIPLGELKDRIRNTR